MNFLKIFLVINLSIVLASCSNSIIVKIDKDKRIITRELKNGKIKTINQKFNFLYHQWFDAECSSKKTSFTKCDDKEIIYTKLATLKIREMQKDLGSSSNEEQSSSNDEDNTSADNDSPEGKDKDDAPNGHPPEDGHPPIDGHPPEDGHLPEDGHPPID